MKDRLDLMNWLRARCLCLVGFTILFRTINFVYSIEVKKSFLSVCTRVWQAAQNSLYRLQMPLFALNLDKLTSLRKEHIGNFIYNSIKLNCLKLIYINEKIKTFWFRKYTKLSKTGDLLFTNQNHKCAHTNWAVVFLCSNTSLLLKDVNL